MFDAIEDIPTSKLIEELQSRGKFVVTGHEATANDVKSLHTLISYMWEDVQFENQDVIELNEHEVATMMDLITRISDQLEITHPIR